MVLHFPIRCVAADTQVPRRAQSEPRESRAVLRPTWHVERQRIRAGCDRDVVEDVFQRPTPGTVAVEVDPGVQLRIAGCILNVDRHRRVQLPDTNRAERHAGFVGVGVCICRMNAIGFRIPTRPQPRAGRFVPRSALGQRRGIPLRRVAKVESQQHARLQRFDQQTPETPLPPAAAFHPPGRQPNSTSSASHHSCPL